MVSITHWDGSDVVVIDARGRKVPAVDEVRVEHDRASVAVHAVHQGARAWLNTLRTSGQQGPVARVIDLRDGRELWCGPVHVAYA